MKYEAEMLAALGRHARRAHRLTSSGTPPPGSSGRPKAVTKISTLAYGPDSLVEAEVTDVAEIAALVDKHPVLWVNVDGPIDPETLIKIGEIFKLHKLALEDVMSNHQRPKVEDYGTHHFMVTRMVVPGDRFGAEQVSMFFSDRFVITFQEQCGGDGLDTVRNRIRKGLDTVRNDKADHLAYCIIDAIVDGYFPVVDAIEDRLDELEERILRDHDSHTPLALHAIKRDLLAVRHTLRPLREAVNSLLRDLNSRVSRETRVYLRDCFDHVVRILDQVETDRELCSDLMNLHMTSAGNRMNEVMKVLTIITTLFTPPIFIAGIYGMNFRPDTSPWNMPELGWYFGYPFALALMILVEVGLFAFLYWKGWLKGLFTRRKSK